MPDQSRYRNPVRLMPVFRVVAVCLLLGLVGGAFVYLRNLHVQKGNQITQLESEISELDNERQIWELRIAGAKDRVELSRRLEWLGSDLRSIDPAKVLKIESNP